MKHYRTKRIHYDIAVRFFPQPVGFCMIEDPWLLFLRIKNTKIASKTSKITIFGCWKNCQAYNFHVRKIVFYRDFIYFSVLDLYRIV